MSRPFRIPRPLEILCRQNTFSLSHAVWGQDQSVHDGRDDQEYDRDQREGSLAARALKPRTTLGAPALVPV